MAEVKSASINTVKPDRKVCMSFLEFFCMYRQCFKEDEWERFAVIWNEGMVSKTIETTVLQLFEQSMLTLGWIPALESKVSSAQTLPSEDKNHLVSGNWNKVNLKLYVDILKARGFQVQINQCNTPYTWPFLTIRYKSQPFSVNIRLLKGDLASSSIILHDVETPNCIVDSVRIYSTPPLCMHTKLRYIKLENVQDVEQNTMIVDE